MGELLFSTSGCLCTLGIRPNPTALRIAFAILRWFFGRRPVSFECFMRPISVMYSDIMVKFCGALASVSTVRPVWLTHLILQHRVDAQDVESVLLGLLPALLPLLLLTPAQVVRRIHVARLPFPVDLALELREPFRLLYLRVCAWAVEACAAGEAQGGGVTGALGAGGGGGIGGVARGAALAEDGEDVVWGMLVTSGGFGGVVGRD
jgi:hypothetical protein